MLSVVLRFRNKFGMTLWLKLIGQPPLVGECSFVTCTWLSTLRRSSPLAHSHTTSRIWFCVVMGRLRTFSVAVACQPPKNDLFTIFNFHLSFQIICVPSVSICVHLCLPRRVHLQERWDFILNLSKKIAKCGILL